MTTIDSTVAGFDTKPIHAKTGKTYTAHYVITADGDKIAVGLKQKYSLGQRINIDVETKYGELKEVGPATGAPTPKNATPANKVPVSSGGSPSGRPFPVPELSGEMAIIRQNALTNAREVVLNASALSLPQEATKAERDQFYDTAIEDILRVAYKFADFASGHREVKAARQRSNLSDTSVGE